MTEHIKHLLLSAPEHEFVIPYIERELWSWRIIDTDDPAAADAAVFIGSSDVYAVHQGENLDESTAIDSRLPLARAEKAFIEEALRRGLSPIVFRCANTVGTGMRGLPMDIAKSIASGTFFHFPTADARLSLIHASDIARAVAAAIEHGSLSQTIYNLTDGQDATFYDLAEAIAFRMNNKRLSTISTKGQQLLGKLLFPGRYRQQHTTLTFDGSQAIKELDFSPVSTIRYLRTHNYDENSL